MKSGCSKKREREREGSTNLETSDIFFCQNIYPVGKYFVLVINLQNISLFALFYVSASRYTGMSPIVKPGFETKKSGSEIAQTRENIKFY